MMWRVAVTLMCVLISACESTQDTALVSIGEERYTAEQLLEYIETLPAAERRVDTTAPEQWWYNKLDDFVEYEILSKEFQIRQLDQSDSFKKLLRTTKSQLVGERWVETNFSPEEINGEQLQTRYAESVSLGLLSAKDQRLLKHIFLEFTGEESREALIEQADAIREKIKSGAAFSQQAQLHSDSETRHNGGLLGWVDKGIYPKALEDIVWQLTAGQISQPVTTQQGIHLFLVEEIVQQPLPGFEQTKSNIRQAMYTELLRDFYRSTINELSKKYEVVAASDAELLLAIREIDTSFTVYSVESFSVSLGDIFDHLQLQSSGKVSADALVAYVQRRLLNELLLMEYERDYSALDQLVENRVYAMALKRYKSQRISQWLREDKALATQYFYSHQATMRIPEKIRATFLSLPIKSDGGDSQAVLAGLSGSDDIDVSDFVEKTGARLNVVQNQSIASLAEKFRGIGGVRAETSDGYWSEPISLYQRFWIVKMESIEPARKATLQEKIPQVVEQLLLTRYGQVLENFRDYLFTDYDARILVTPEQLQTQVRQASSA